jgi:hypothetical protein
MKIRLLAVSGLSLTFTFLAVAQSFAKNIDDTEFEKWKKKHNQEVSNFVEKYDKDFASFLKTRWVETDVIAGEQRDNQPKPKQTPEKQAEPVVDETPVEIVLPDIEPEQDTSEVPELPLPKDKVPDTKVKPPFYYVADDTDSSGKNIVGKSIEVSLLGQTLIMPKVTLPTLTIKKLSSGVIAELWLAMASSDYKPAIAAIEQASHDLKLDDWGNALLTHKFLISQTGLTQNERQLLTWFYLVKQGFDARVAFDKNEIYLLLNTAQTLFAQKFFTFDEQKYYFVDFAKTRPINIGSVYTYEQQYSSAKKAVKIDMRVAPLQGESDKTRVLKTKIGKQSVSVTAPYNSNYIDFLNFYPQVSMQYYFQAELPEQTKISLLSQLKQDIAGLSELEAANFLLHFVQTSLQYQTDQQQFNYENYLFAGETLHYPYADCEDRSVFFAYLVTHLMGNKVVGLQYDGHVATAVALKSKTSGSSFLINNVRYTIADPTFINANVGEVMTGFEGVEPELVIY